MRLARPLALVLVLASSTGLAQGKKGDASDDSVVLKNGTTVTGKVLDEDPKTGVTIKLANGKVRVIPAAEVKLVERTLPPEKGDKPAKQREKPEPEPEPEPKAPKKTETKDDDDAYAHPAMRWGLGGELGLVLSRANSAGDLKLLSPFLGVHAAIDVGLSRRVYLRIDPTIATLSRSSEIPSVPKQLAVPLDPMQRSTLTQYSSVGTKLRLVDVLVRGEIGYDYTPMLTSRIGVLAGVAIQLAKGDICDSSTDLGLTYGLSLHPIAARFGDKRALEVALGIDYASIPVKRCTTSVPNGYVPVPNTLIQFQPVFVRDRIGVGVVGVGATYLFD